MMNNKFSTRLVSVAAGFIYVLLGIVMIQNPDTALKALSVIFGWFFVVAGFLAIIFALMIRKTNKEIGQSNLSDGMLLLVLALVFLLGSFIDNTLFFSYLLILWILIDSVFQIQVLSMFPLTGITTVVMIMDILLVIFAIILLFNPIAVQGFLVLYIGIGFISTGFAKMLKSY